MTSAANPTTSIPRRPIARWKILLAVALIVLGGLGLWAYPGLKRQAEVGVAYGARMGCSCRFVQGRDIASCATDAEPGMEMISIADVDGERAVQASVPLLASRIARFDGATGCVLAE